MPDPTRRGLLRRSILGILWVFLAIAVFDTIIGPVLNRSGWKTGAGIIAAMSVLFGLLSSLVGFVLLLFEVAYLRRLADFVPDRRLSQRFHTLYTVALYAIPVFVLVSGVFVLIGYLLPTGPGQAGFSPFLLVALPASIFAVGLFVYQIFFLVALFKIGSRAGVALKQAEEREQEIAYNASRIA
jgi:hypothetical protein